MQWVCELEFSHQRLVATTNEHKRKFIDSRIHRFIDIEKRLVYSFLYVLAKRRVHWLPMSSLIDDIFFVVVGCCLSHATNRTEPNCVCVCVSYHIKCTMSQRRSIVHSGAEWMYLNEILIYDFIVTLQKCCRILSKERANRTSLIPLF